MVSELREDARFRHLSVSDVYEHPTVATLASALDAGASRAQPPRPARPRTATREKHRTGTRSRHLRAGLLLAGGLYFVFGFNALQWVTPYLVYFLLLANGRSIASAAAWAAASAMDVFPLLLLAAVAAKWLLLGRIRVGRHPLWGGYYVR